MQTTKNKKKEEEKVNKINPTSLKQGKKHDTQLLENINIAWASQKEHFGF